MIIAAIMVVLVGIIGAIAYVATVKNGSSSAAYASALAACGAYPDGSVQDVVETSRLVIKLPKGLYPNQSGLLTFKTASGAATAGWISNAGPAGESYGASSDCWAWYYDFEGRGEVDLIATSSIAGVSDYVLHFNIVSNPADASSTAGISTWKTYTNSTYDFSFQYPPTYTILADQLLGGSSSKYVQVALRDESHGQATYIEIFGETLPNNCYKNLCDLPAKSRLTLDDITWDFLGETTYCDAGMGCTSSPATYRTLKNDMRYYVSFSSTDEAESMLQTFKFWN